VIDPRPIEWKELNKSLEHLKNKKINLLEIGIVEEINMWKEYFGNAEIYGFDSNPAIVHYKSDEINLFFGNQAIRSDLEMILDEKVRFDVIIDNGSGIDGHQLVTLATLFPCLKNDSVYIIKDTHYNPHTVTVFEQFNRNKTLPTSWLTENEKIYLTKNIKSCQINPKFLLIKKIKQFI
jgi:hypothetical protein